LSDTSIRPIEDLKDKKNKKLTNIYRKMWRTKVKRYTLSLQFHQARVDYFY